MTSFAHLKDLPDGSLTQREVILLVNVIEAQEKEVERLREDVAAAYERGKQDWNDYLNRIIDHYDAQTGHTRVRTTPRASIR